MASTAPGPSAAAAALNLALPDWLLLWRNNLTRGCARPPAALVHQIKPIIVLPQGVASDDQRPADRWRYPIVVRLSLATVCASRPVTGDGQCGPACRWRWLLREWVRLAVGSANHAATSRVDAHCVHR